MENPLAELEAWWEAAYDDGNAGTRRDEFASVGEGYRLSFTTFDDADAKASWRLEIDGIEEAKWHLDWDETRWRMEWDEPEWSEDHPLLIPHRSTGALISFAKPFRDPLRAWGAAAQAHRKLVDDWFPLDRFFRTDLLQSDFGQLASGPATLLQAYADALRSVSEEIGYTPQVEWSLDDPLLSVMTWGASYFVARSFRLERL